MTPSNRMTVFVKRSKKALFLVHILFVENFRWTSLQHATHSLLGERWGLSCYGHKPGRNHRSVVPDISAWNESTVWSQAQCGHWVSQPQCNHVGVYVVVRTEECDGLCITNGLWLVIVWDEPHLSLFPWLWHPHMSLFPNHHKSTHHQRPYLVPEFHLEAVNPWWLPNTVSSLVIDEGGFQFTDVLMHSLISLSLWTLIRLNFKPCVMMACITIVLNECCLILW